MENVQINVQDRATGRSAIRRLAREGYVPGVLYNHGDSIPVALEYDSIRKILDKNGDEGIVLDTYYKGEHLKALVKEVQRDPVTKEIKHIDLMPADGGVLH